MSHIGRLRRSQQSAALKAKDQLAKFWALYGKLPADELRGALLTFVPALGERYGDLAAAAAADWYEEVKLAETGKPGAAVLADVDRDALVEATRWAVGDLYHGDPIETWRKLEKSLLRHVKNAGRGTVQRSAQRDGVAFARVPSGAKTCAFCEMLASRGFVYGSAELAGSIHRYHDGCDCQQVPEFAMSAAERAEHDAKTEEMYERYSAARREVEADGFSASEANILQRLRDMYPDRYTDGVEIPSIVRDLDQGWPEGVKPIPGRTWRHILRRHGPGGAAHDLFPDDMSEYEIAKVVRDVMAAPDYTAPHPERPGTTLNYFRTIAGQKYVVGTYLDGQGRLTIATCFPVHGNGGIL